jgi:hypothetical protein
MATTTNYGWTTPDDTALVKDGASAIRTLGTSVDTTTKNLNPQTTLGDIAYRSSTSNVNTRLGIGTTGQVLTVASGVPSWAAPAAAGMTLLSTTSLSGATTTISSIDQTYNNLFLVISGVTNATANGQLRIAPNNSTSITSLTISQGGALAQTSDNYLWASDVQSDIGRTSANNIFTISINNYASSSIFKTIHVLYGYINASSNKTYGSNFGYIASATAVTSLVFSNGSGAGGGNLSTGTVLVYGVK